MNEVIDSHSDCRRLVILIHGLGQDVSRLSAMKVVVAETWPNAAIFAPQLPLAVLSMQDPNEIVADLLKKIDEEIDNAAGRGVAYDDVVLIGHSVGSILARKLYVVACGEIERYPLEKIYRKAFGTAEHELIRARDWAGKVSRIVLMAGMNRGWSISNHFGFLKLCAYLTGTLVGNILSMLLRKRPLAFTVRRGAEFITQLRIHWIVMRKNACSTEQGSTKLAGRAGNALTIQLLGSRDDLVSPDDNIDLASGGDFVYLDVPNSGHADVINLGSGSHRSIVEDARRDCFLKALTLSAKELEHESIIPSDDKISRPDDNILSVVFVIHGIRDVGYWTQKIARQIRKRANAHAAEWATETSSYGYFPMLHFFLPWMRRKKVEWLMDQYAEAIARYPNASFSYVGHSHGTYLVARALELYPCCRFKRIVFAGSVVRRNYNWTALVTGADPRVGSVLNFVASKDWVVALFPKFFEIFPIQDLGSAGHDGFAVVASSPHVHQIRHIYGGHSSGIEEPVWGAIAEFIISGSESLTIDRRVERRNSLIELLGRFPPLTWAVLLIFLVFLWQFISFAIGPNTFASGFSLAVYLLILWILLTRL